MDEIDDEFDDLCDDQDALMALMANVEQAGFASTPSTSTTASLKNTDGAAAAPPPSKVPRSPSASDSAVPPPVSPSAASKPVPERRSPRLSAGTPNSRLPPPKSTATPSHKSPRRSPKPHTPRRFPGPAGSLPPLGSGFRSLDEINKKIGQRQRDVNDESNRSDPTVLSADNHELEQGAWLRMKREMDVGGTLRKQLEREGIFNVNALTVDCIIRQGYQRKVPVLAVYVKAFSPTESDARVTLKDQTGEIFGTVHQGVLVLHEHTLRTGSVLVLRQLSVFRPNAKAHYLNITPENIVRVYPPDDDTDDATLSQMRRSQQSMEEQKRRHARRKSEEALERRRREKGKQPRKRPVSEAEHEGKRHRAESPVGGARGLENGREQEQWSNGAERPVRGAREKEAVESEEAGTSAADADEEDYDRLCGQIDLAMLEGTSQ